MNMDILKVSKILGQIYDYRYDRIIQYKRCRKIRTRIDTLFPNINPDEYGIISPYKSRWLHKI